MNWADVGKKAEQIAGAALPAVGTALGGPAGAAIGAGIAHILGVDATPEAVSAAITPDNVVQLKQIDAGLREAQIKAESDARTGQIQVNQTEAAAAAGQLGPMSAFFVAGWRPAVGWVCATAFGWTFIVAPLVAYIAALLGFAGKLPELDLSQLMPVLLGMLGLGAMRTVEKVKGIKSGT